MSADTLIALIIIAVVLVAVVALGVSKLIERVWGEPEEEALAPKPPVTPPAQVPASPSAPLPAAVRALLTERRREKLIEALVAAGWGTGEIRMQLKGDSGTIGEEVRAARIRLGLADPDQRVTPLAGRPVPDGVIFVDDLAQEPAP